MDISSKPSSSSPPFWNATRERRCTWTFGPRCWHPSCWSTWQVGCTSCGADSDSQVTLRVLHAVARNRWPGNVLIAVAQILVPFDHNWSIFLVAACFAPYFVACGCLLRSYFASVQYLKDPKRPGLNTRTVYKLKNLLNYHSMGL